MGRRLIDNLTPVTLAVIDFEYTTPTGLPPEPIEVAAQTVDVHDGALHRGWAWEALIKPPPHGALTGFDTAQTGITTAMLTDQPPAEKVLANLDAHLADHLNGRPAVLVAHNAPAEERILYRFREHCPRLAATDLLDTVRLARDRYPDLARHTLDELLRHLQIPAPPDRHRAMPDVQATTDVLIALLHGETRWPDLRTLRAVAGYPARAAEPEQGSLFE